MRDYRTGLFGSRFRQAADRAEREDLLERLQKRREVMSPQAVAYVEEHLVAPAAILALPEGQQRGAREPGAEAQGAPGTPLK